MCLNVSRVNYIEKNGKKLLDWKASKADFDENKPFVIVPCGKCVECLQAYSNSWVTRCQAELFNHKQACFLTLTYRESPIVLVKKDFQNFMKRLRFLLADQFGITVRYFGCGEYGSKKKRPHYHVIIFGWRPDDLRYLYSDNGIKIYTSKTVEDIWQHGFVSVGLDMSEKAIRYQCKYLQKKGSGVVHPVTGECVAPFLLMSRRPGIGANITFADCTDYKTDKLYLNGKTIPIPRYYLQRAERLGKDVSTNRKKRLSFLFLRGDSSLSVRKAKSENYQKKFGFSID